MSTINCVNTQYKVLKIHKVYSYPQNIVHYVGVWITFADKSLDYLFQTDEKEVGYVPNVLLIAGMAAVALLAVRLMKKNSTRRQGLSCLGTIHCIFVRFSCYFHWITKIVLD